MKLEKNVAGGVAAFVFSIGALLSTGATASVRANAVGHLHPLIDDCNGNPSGCTIKCNARGVGSVGSGFLITPAEAKAGAFLGSTPEEIHQRFAVIQEMNFAQGNTKVLLSRLSDKELGDIASLYNQSAPAGDDNLMRTFAQKLDGASLVRVAKAFGSVSTTRAVNAYAPAKIKADFERKLAIAISVPKYSRSVPSFTSFGSVSTMASPNTDMTLGEIYLEYRTAPLGSLSPASALSETAMYAGSRLVVAWGAGYAFGTVIHNLIETYDPALDDVIGGTIQQAIDNIGDAANEWQQGNWEGSADSLFGTPVGNTGDYSGDWNVGQSYDYYEGGSGGGC